MIARGETFRHTKATCLVAYGDYLNEPETVDKAVQYFRKALLHEPDNVHAHAGLASAFITKGLFTEALHHCLKAALPKPTLRSDLLLIVIFEFVGQEHKAKEILSRITTLFCDNDPPSALSRLAYTYFVFGFYDKAEFYSKQALRLAPERPKLHGNLAWLYVAQNRYKEAIEEMEIVRQLATDKSLREYAEKWLRRSKKLMVAKAKVASIKL